jgi:hypothetical protein
MNRVLNIYADADAFFDYRRALLQYLMTEKDFPEPTSPLSAKEAMERLQDRKAQGDRLWTLHCEKNYKERRLDTFNFPQLGIDEAKFKEIFDKRSVDHWATGMFYPSRLITQMVSRVIDIEGLTDKPVDIKEVRLWVNTFPYQFGEDLTAQLVENIRYGLRGIVNVKAIESDPATHDSNFYKQYDYVFRYNMLIDESSRQLMETFKTNPIPDTAFVVPDILAREDGTFASNVKDWMLASYLWLGPALKVLPIEHSLYDYDE